jgi:hypothetical protein
MKKMDRVNTMDPRQQHDAATTIATGNPSKDVRFPEIDAFELGGDD